MPGVGTQCAIALFMASDDDPLFLQVKEARRSGRSGRWNRAVAAFAMDYADQNERDLEAMQRAVREGRIEASHESEDEDR